MRSNQIPFVVPAWRGFRLSVIRFSICHQTHISVSLPAKVLSDGAITLDFALIKKFKIFSQIEHLSS
jgi:hypothetical protein